jgi:diguanylate cyclase (GGDEF)-like protein
VRKLNSPLPKADVQVRTGPGQEVESSAVAIDIDQRVEELEAAVERRAASPSSPPAPIPPAEPPSRRAARDGRRGDWAPFIVITALLAVGSMYVSYGQAQWFSVIGGILAMGALGQAILADRGRLRIVSQPISLILVGVGLVVCSELLHAMGAGFLSYADALALLSYPPLIAGLIKLTQARFRESALDTLLVAAIVPASLGVFAWLPLVEAIHRWVPGGNQHTWTAAVFLTVDVLAVAIVARLAVFFRGKPMAYQLLLGALTCLLGAHISRTAAYLTDMVPAPFGSQSLMLLGFGLIAAASLHPSMRRATRMGRARSVPVGRGHLGLLSLTILLGPAIVIWRYVERGSWVILAAAGPALVSLLVVMHLSRMIRERQRLEFATNHDPLTGLVNRSCFHDRVTLALGRGDGAGAAVLFLDLDRFKNVNDTLGHDAGDELLRLVADRLGACARASDTVARISGDEFAVLLPGAENAGQATRLAERMLAQFDTPFRVAGRSLFMTPSVGIAMHPDHGTDVDTLLRHADAAMYQAKGAGRHTIRVYDGVMGASAQRQLAVETRMHQAIADGELVLHYQPKLDVRTGDVLGLEALVRWEHPTQGLIPPKAFIRVAEETGLVAPLGGWVLHEACTQMAGWYALGHDELHVSVNVSARQFKLQDVPALVRGVLEDTGLPPEALELELTESVGIDPDGSVGAALLELQELGVRCSIDDFGTGYSSISYLHEYPVDTIKLDRSFVQDIGDGQDAPIVRAVIAMAHNLGLRVVAEGVETKAQLKFLRKHGCDGVQGFLFSRPLPALGVPAFLDARAAMTPAGRRRVPTMRVVALATAAVALDEEALGRLLWEESELNATEDLLPFAEEEEEEEEENGRRGLMIFSTAAILLVPVLLGLGAGGGLPPTIQNRVSDVAGAAGVSQAERVPVANPTHVALLAEPTSTTSRGPAKRKPAQAIGDGPRRGAAFTLSPRSGAARPSTRPHAAPVAGKPVKKPAKKKAPAAGGPATGPTTAPVVTTAKPKGSKSVAPGKVKKSTTVAPGASSGPAPTTTFTPLKGKDHGKKP